jgi:hypothetical protein
MVPPNLPGLPLSPTKILLPSQSPDRGFQDLFTVIHAPPVARETICNPLPSVTFKFGPDNRKIIATAVIIAGAVFLLSLGEYVRRKSLRKEKNRGRWLGLRLGNRNQDQNVKERRGEGNAPPAQVLVTHPPALRLGSRQERDGTQSGAFPTQTNYASKSGWVGDGQGAHPDSSFKPDGNAVTLPPSSCKRWFPCLLNPQI